MAKIGDALKRAVETRPEDGADTTSGARPSSALMNANRRRIFQFLCSRPCSDLSATSAGVGLSRSSVSWHMDALVEADYLTVFMRSGRPRYCPSGLVSPANMALFAALAEDGCGAVLTTVTVTPGMDRAMLASATGMGSAKVGRCVSSLLEVGLLARVRDGRHARYFPTDRLEAAMPAERRALKEFVRRLVRRLAAEHLRPDVTEMKGADVVITLGILGRTERLEIPFQKKVY
jgi:DNA-binding transcriptional ArsR family regulator